MIKPRLEKPQWDKFKLAAHFLRKRFGILVEIFRLFKEWVFLAVSDVDDPESFSQMILCQEVRRLLTAHAPWCLTGCWWQWWWRSQWHRAREVKQLQTPEFQEKLSKTRPDMGLEKRMKNVNLCTSENITVGENCFLLMRSNFPPPGAYLEFSVRV